MKMINSDIIVEVYNNKNILRYCKTLTKEYEELRSQLIIQLIKMNSDKLIKSKEKNYLEYLCLTICKRIIWGGVKDTGMFYKTKFNKNEHFVLIDDILSNGDLDCNFEDIKLKGEKIEEILLSNDDFEDIKLKEERIEEIYSIIETLHWYDRALFNYYYIDGYKLKEISEMTGINLKSIHANIKKSRDYIKEKIK